VLYLSIEIWSISGNSQKIKKMVVGGGGGDNNNNNDNCSNDNDKLSKIKELHWPHE